MLGKKHAHRQLKVLFFLFLRNRLAKGLQLTHNHLGNLQLVAQYLTILGSLALALHDTVQAREILRSSLTLAKKLYDIPTQIWVLSVLTSMHVIYIFFLVSINILVQ